MGFSVIQIIMNDQVRNWTKGSAHNREDLRRISFRCIGLIWDGGSSGDFTTIEGDEVGGLLMSPFGIAC